MDRVIKNNIDDLPEHLLFHVLSFLDAKSLVRTGVLCKRWRSLWKDTPALNLQYCSDWPFERIHVEKLLLSLGSDRKKSLRNLTLARSWFQGPSEFSGFSSLTTLELTECAFYAEKLCTTGSPAILLPLADLPSLKHLKLIDCSADRAILSLPHVLDLEIQARFNLGFSIEQLLAPKLESLTFSSHVDNLVDPSSSQEGEVRYDLPSLDRATIRIAWKEVSDVVTVERRDRSFMPLFHGMRNAKSLDLYFDEEVCYMCFLFLIVGPFYHRHENYAKGPWGYLNLLLNKIKSVLVNRDSPPFTALKTLKIQYPREFTRQGFQVINYRFDEDGGYVEEKSQSL